MFDNILLMTDSYKVSHWKQYPPKTTKVFSYLESRGGEFPSTLFFGLSYILQRYFEGRVVTQEKIEEAARFFKLHFGSEELFNRVDWEYIVQEHGGRLPVEIKAVREGTLIPNSNVLLTIENTDDECAWLVNYLETLLVQVWYPITVATQSYYMKQDIKRAMEVSCDSLAGLPFKLHDFGYRGSTSVESAGIGGCAHLVNFQGTDTMAALEVAAGYYDEEMAGFSIPAAEHSTITGWGVDQEIDAYRNMLQQYPSGLVAVVSDSYNIYKAVDHIWGELLKDEVLARDGVVIIRPDSGDPVKVVRTLLDTLGVRFGYTINTKGFKVLNPHVRLIQGDGIDRHSLREILQMMLSNGWSIDNIAFGSGGGLLQKMNRDTNKFAMKCSAIEVDGTWRDVSKNPIEMRSKKSKSGRLILCDDGTGDYTTGVEGDGTNLLQTVFHNGSVSKCTLQEVRYRAQG